MLIYTDGGCRYGIGAWAWWCETTDESGSGVATETTNQRMEMTAVAEAIGEYFSSKSIVIMSDSAYVVNCFTQQWFTRWIENGWKSTSHGPIRNQDLWAPLIKAVQDHGNVKFIKVKGHSGNIGNQIVDNLCTERILKYTKELKHARPKAAPDA